MIGYNWQHVNTQYRVIMGQDPFQSDIPVSYNLILRSDYFDSQFFHPSPPLPISVLGVKIMVNLKEETLVGRSSSRRVGSFIAIKSIWKSRPFQKAKMNNELW
jgi:hypothetical protein